MSYWLAWKDILSISEQVFKAYEYDQVSLDDWLDIEPFLKEAYDQAKMATAIRPGFVPGGAPPAYSSAPQQSGHAKSDNPKKKWMDNANGVPWTYMKSKNICCGYNILTC